MKPEKFIKKCRLNYEITYKRGLDKKDASIIKGKNANTGKNSQHIIVKRIKQDENDDNFNKEYNNYFEKRRFKNKCKALDSFNQLG